MLKHLFGNGERNNVYNDLLMRNDGKQQQMIISETAVNLILCLFVKKEATATCVCYHWPIRLEIDWQREIVINPKNRIRRFSPISLDYFSFYFL